MHTKIIKIFHFDTAEIHSHIRNCETWDGMNYNERKKGGHTPILSTDMYQEPSAL